MTTALLDNEAEIREALDAGDLNTVARLALREHGAIVRRFMLKRLRDRDRAEEAYLDFGLRFWTALPSFKGACPIRVWMFKIASHAADTLSLRIARRREELIGDDCGAVPQLAEMRRTTTAPFLRTGIKDAMRELRCSLPNQDQNLLLLHVWQRMDWPEVAIAMGEVEPDASEMELRRASARMRTRFQTAKARYKKLAQDVGLVEDTQRSSRVSE